MEQTLASQKRHIDVDKGKHKIQEQAAASIQSFMPNPARRTVQKRRLCSAQPAVETDTPNENWEEREFHREVSGQFFFNEK